MPGWLAEPIGHNDERMKSCPILVVSHLDLFIYNIAKKK